MGHVRPAPADDAASQAQDIPCYMLSLRGNNYHAPESVRSGYRRTGCPSRARPGLWGVRRATVGSTRRCWATGIPTAIVASVQAAELNPEIRIVVVHKDNLPTRGKRKPTLCMWRKAAVLSYNTASEGGYHRGLRTGHVCTGVARELGRAHAFPAILCRSEGYRLTKGSWR